ncbi:hypothetical protein L3X38_039370 [Prunus dulcis]|uniref:Uncharacterized protein n=1 Tax=Prunus dulcis TaxID=3755 RepID=A0AAD4V8G6_PRUDU|nr:hypothetical protein L3X38_039370 [Prunus dulcis]
MASNDHDDEDMAKALAYIEHMLLDYDDELEEDVHAEENEQLAVKIQEFEAFLLGTDAIAAEQPQPEQGSFFYGNHAVRESRAFKNLLPYMPKKSLQHNKACLYNNRN